MLQFLKLEGVAAFFDVYNITNIANNLITYSWSLQKNMSCKDENF